MGYLIKTDAHFQRLTQCVDWSIDKTSTYRELNQMLVDASMGQFYPRFVSQAPDTPINLMGMTHRAWSRSLFMRDPRAMANTAVPQYKSFSEDAAIALNQTIQEAEFGRVISEVVDQSLYSVGALEMTADYVGTPYGMRQKLCLESIAFPDLIWDPDCSRMHESDYIGRRMYLPLVDVREHPMFDEAARMRVQATHSDVRSDDKVSNFQRAGRGPMSRQLYDYVELYRVYDRRRRRLYVWPANDPSIKLMDMEWNGPEHGPIRFLHFGTPPGHPFPKAPMMDVYRLHRATNILLARAMRQQQMAKGVLLYNSASRDEAKDMVDAVDLQSVLQEHGGLRWAHVGGAAPDTISMSELTRKLFSYAVGNLDQLLGLGSQAPTLGQERMLSEASSANMQDMGQVVYLFVKQAVNDAYWFNIRDPQTREKLWKKLGQTGISYSVDWTPEKREYIEKMKFQVDVEPYSYKSRTPEGRLADLLGSLQVLGEYMPMMMAQGMSIDMEGVVRTIAQYRDLPELYDVLILNQDPERLQQLLGPKEGATPMQQFGGQNKPNGNYTRRSESDGAGENMELLRSFGRNPQSQFAEAAA